MAVVKKKRAVAVAAASPPLIQGPVIAHKRGRGRPTLFNAQIAEEICTYVANGGVMTNGRMPDHFPDAATIWAWSYRHDDFRKAYAHARDVRQDYLVEEMIEIAKFEPEVDRAKLMVDVRKFHATKLAPKRFGDRIQTEATINVNQTTNIDLSGLSEKARKELLKELESQLTLDSVEYKEL